MMIQYIRLYLKSINIQHYLNSIFESNYWTSKKILIKLRLMIIKKIGSICSAAKHLALRLRVPHCLYSYEETKAILSILYYEEILTARHQQNEHFTCLQHRLVKLTNQYIAKESKHVATAGGTDNKNYDKQAVDEMIAMFTTGVYLNILVFGQDNVTMANRYKKGKKRTGELQNSAAENFDKRYHNQKIMDAQNLIDFRPTFMVTQEIFNYFEQNNYNQSMIYGPDGISKTFSTIFYHRLSQNINTYLFKNIKPLPQFYDILYANDQCRRLPQKLIYWSIDPYNTEVLDIMENLTLQCPEIKNDKLIQSIIRKTTLQLDKYILSQSEIIKDLKLKWKLNQFCIRLSDIYLQKDIRITVFIDQINIVASAFRDYNAKIEEINTKITQICGSQFYFFSRYSFNIIIAKYLAQNKKKTKDINISLFEQSNT